METFKLSSVKITEGPFYNAQQTSLKYILEMDVDRLLAPFLAEAGLRDTYLFAGNEKALEILTGLSDWCYDLTENLSDEQMQDMLRSEFGGMNEVLADVAFITGSDRYLRLAERFAHRAILDPLVDRRDNNLSFRMADELLYTPEMADELVLVPFFEIHETRYMLFWPVEDN